ncbi:MAG: AraC family transcriptional regulator ligand-binding domain-containing protein [Agitococcus sp.]|nr:AraC family transcriptional regulator ligand-binding domain-containing protein [Agitococcus sp.]
MQANNSSHTVYVAGMTANLLLSYLDQQGLAVSELREKLTRLASLPRMPITTWWALLEEIYQLQPIVGLGLAIGRCTRPHHVGVLGYLSMYCETVGQALMRFHRFQPLLHNLSPTMVRQEAETIILSWQPRTSTQLSNEVVVASLMTVLSHLTGQVDVSACLLEWPHPAPVDPIPYQQCFACPIVFNAKTVSIHIPLAIMALPINSRDPFLVSLLEQQAEALMMALPNQDVLLKTIQQHILAILQDEVPELKTVSVRMGVSERSLYRYLSARGLRYKTVLNNLRYELAKNYLKNMRLSLPEIALMLGFSEQSAFSRAFKEWSGQSPMHYRRAS